MNKELRRLHRLFQLEHGSLGVLYGRRRCGKSRLILESASVANLIYYFGDDREASIHRENLAREMNSMIPGFADVRYPNWEALLSRWFRDCPPRSILAMDEFPAVVKSSTELPSLLQKVLEARPPTRGHLLLCGSSQGMMQGLILDRTAPLYGRAREILKITPLPADWLEQAFPGLDAVSCIEAYSCWGGVPRYWELAQPFATLEEADGVAESQDGSSLLFVSAKWQENLSFEAAWNELRRQASTFPEIGARRPYLALFCKRPAGRPDTFGPNDVLGALR